MQQIIQFTIAWVVFVTVVLLIRHRYEPAKVEFGHRLTAWLLAVAATVPVLAIVFGLVWPGLHPLRPDWQDIELPSGMTRSGLALVFACLLGLPVVAIGAAAMKRRSYAWFAILLGIGLAVLTFTRDSGAALRIVCLTAGLTGIFWAAGAMFRKDNEEPSTRRTVVMYLVTLLVPLGLAEGYAENDRLHAAALASGLADPARTEQVATKIADLSPWSPRAPQARIIADAAQAKTYLVSSNELLSPSAVITRFGDLVRTSYVGTILDRYHEACLRVKPSADCDALLQLVMAEHTKRTRDIARSSPWPENASLLETLIPLDELDGYSEVDKLVDDIAGNAALRIRALKTPVPPVVSTKFAQCTNDYKGGRYKEAAGCYREMAALTPQVVDVRNNLGLTEWRLGHYTVARIHFAIITKTAPKYLGAELNLAVVEYTSGREEAALDRLKRLIKATPKYAFGNYNLAWMLDEKGDAAASRTAAAAALSAKPDHLNARILLAYMAVKGKRFAEASQILTDAEEYANESGKLTLTAFAGAVDMAKTKPAKPAQ